MRPVFIVAQGPSVRDLKLNIDAIKARYPDAIWCGMNQFDIIEESLGIRFDYVFYSDPHLLGRYIDLIKSFLHSTDRVKHFISDYDTIKDIEELGKFRVANANGSVIYSSQSRGKIESVDKRFYNSLTALLLTMIGLGHREFVLFGCDGGGDPKGELYYGVEPGANKDDLTPPELARRLGEDTKLINEKFMDFKEAVTSEFVYIVNMSYLSHITCFQKLAYWEFLR